jgi:hypothetical protein
MAEKTNFQTFQAFFATGTLSAIAGKRGNLKLLTG